MHWHRYTLSSCICGCCYHSVAAWLWRSWGKARPSTAATAGHSIVFNCDATGYSSAAGATASAAAATTAANPFPADTCRTQSPWIRRANRSQRGAQRRVSCSVFYDGDRAAMVLAVTGIISFFAEVFYVNRLLAVWTVCWEAFWDFWFACVPVPVMSTLSTQSVGGRVRRWWRVLGTPLLC